MGFPGVRDPLCKPFLSKQTLIFGWRKQVRILCLTQCDRPPPHPPLQKLKKILATPCKSKVISGQGNKSFQIGDYHNKIGEDYVVGYFNLT